ncbi:MAG: S-layer homology domain-containing protein [Oscillospiraceae bacterium]
MKKFSLVVLIISLIMGLCLPAVASYSPFLDVADSETQHNIDVLRMMGAVQGDDKGNFRPNDKLTRAEFCKMAVIVMGRGDEEYLYRNRTIFPDVRANHWARGYINLAVSSDNKIIIGNSEGTFCPDDNITYAQAVTMLMRMLGYTDSDAGMLWPQGYLALAGDCGLTEGVNLSADVTITRVQAAALFCNLLASDQKKGGEYVSNLGTVHRDAVVMSDDATADNGQSGAIKTSDGTYLPKTGIAPSSFVGQRGLFVTDSDDYAVAFVPDRGKTLSIVATSAQAGWVKDSTGKTYTVSSDVPAYTSDTEGTFGEMWVNIYTGCKVNLYYTDAGKVAGVFINDSVADTAAVVYGSVSGNPFASLLNGERSYTVYKDGVPASASDIRQYDVATYDKSSKILHVSDVRLTGIYEDASPNREYPSVISVMGKKFSVLPSAVSSLKQFDIGDNITLLLTSDLQVAGAVSTSAARSNAVGIVKSCTANSAEVQLFIGITVSGELHVSDSAAQGYCGQLVTVSSSGKGKLGLSKLSGSGVSGNLNMDTRTIGSLALSDSVKFFEQVGNSELRQIEADDILQDEISSSHIAYVAKDYAGRANIVVLNDVTGDMYTYGMIETGRITVSIGSDEYGLEGENRTIAIINGDGKTNPFQSAASYKDDDFAGIVPALDGKRAAGVISLESIEGVKRSDFQTGDPVTLHTDKGVFVVSDDVVCYNSVTEQWFNSLDEARSFSDNLTVYYDKLPEQGGKIRVVVAN